MSTNVTAADVKRRLGSSDLPDDDITNFVEQAERLYDQRIDGEHVEDDLRDDVIEALAAHLIATGPERQIDSGGEGGGNVSFAGDTGEGLRATTHGQMAILLDPTGQLDGGDDGDSDDFTLST